MAAAEPLGFQLVYGMFYDFLNRELRIAVRQMRDDAEKIPLPVSRLRPSSRKEI